MGSRSGVRVVLRTGMHERGIRKNGAFDVYSGAVVKECGFLRRTPVSFRHGMGDSFAGAPRSGDGEIVDQADSRTLHD